MPEMVTIPREQLSALQQRADELAETLRRARQDLETGPAVHGERWRLALDAVNDGLWDWNVPTGEAHFSPRYYTMLGYAPGEFSSSYASFEKLVYPADLPALQQALSAHVAGKRDSYEIEFRAVTKTGEVRWILTRGKVVERDPADNPLRMVGTHSDITARKRAEESLAHSHEELRETLRDLQQSRDMLQTVIESIPIRVFWKDLHLRYLGCNTLFARDGGFHQPSELLGLDDYAAGWREQADLYRADDRCVIESRQPRLNIVEPQTTPAGDTIWLSTSKVPLCRPDGQVFGMLGVYEDITARKQAEQSEREMTALMQHIVRNDPNAIAVYDRDLRYLAVSNRYLADYDVKEESIIGRHHYDVFPEMPQRWKDVHQRCLAGAIERNDDDCFDRPDGSVTYNRWECRPWFTFNGEIGGIITYTEVTTERKLAEKALKDSEERYRSLFDGVPLGLYRTAPDGQILEANPALVEMLGYPDLESLLPVNVRDLDVDSADRAKEAGLLSRGADLRQFVKLRRRDGTVIWVRNTARPILAADGRLLRIEGTLEDITEHKRLEEQYLQAQKMEMVGRLAGGVAHDFNNLLTAISGYAGLVKKSLPSGTVARSDIDQVILASERAAQLTRRLLAFSRRQIIEQKVVDLNQLILEMDKMLRRLIGEDIELVTVPGANLGAVKVDPGQIEQVLVNLAVNARDAMPHGGKLTIEMANVTLGDEYVRQHVDVSAGEYVLLAVSDTGTGMTDEAKAHIFEPFFTTKDVGKGTGLGLATVYGIVKQHQGHIWVYSEPGQGTAFKIYLPRVAAKPEGPAPRDDIAELPRGHETVLVVEDEALVRRLTVKNLTDLGYTVLEAASGDDALRVFHSHAGTIDLLLTDVIMPQMNGNRLAAQLKALRPALAVLFTSGYTDETIAHRGVLDEGVAFLQKPFTTAGLARKVREVLRGREDKPRD